MCQVCIKLGLVYSRYDKPDKVSHDHRKLPEVAGGLSFIDIYQFW